MSVCVHVWAWGIDLCEWMGLGTVLGEWMGLGTVLGELMGLGTVLGEWMGLGTVLGERACQLHHKKGISVQPIVAEECSLRYVGCDVARLEKI